MLSTLSLLEDSLGCVHEMCAPSTDKLKELLQHLKSLFDLSTKVNSDLELGHLAELYVTNLDSESVWEQVQSRNRPLNRYIEKNTKKLSEHLLFTKMEEMRATTTMKEKKRWNDFAKDEEDISNENMNDTSDHSRSDDGDDAISCDSQDYAHDDAMEESGFRSAEYYRNDMDHWLDEMDEAESLRIEKQLSKDKSQNLQDDYYDAEEENDEDFVRRELYELSSNDSYGSEDDMADVKYDDFFGIESNDIVAEVSSNDQEEDKETLFDSAERPALALQTEYSRRKNKIQEQITLLEDAVAGVKPWEVTGEVKSSQRPENSLLGLPVDIERSSKITPLLNHEYLKDLEDMITQRIKDSNYDNLIASEEKGKYMDVSNAKAEVSQEKSKLGLGEIYAEEFLKQSANFDANMSKQDKDVSDMIQHFLKVCRQLDALSHFQFAPRPVGTTEDLSSMSVDAIALEDVAPISMLVDASVNAKAPEQIVGKKRGLGAQFADDSEEITRTDKQKMRRKQKKKQNKTLLSPKLISIDNDNYQDLKNDKRVFVGGSRADISKKSDYSKSSDFFSRLQENVRMDISSKKKPEGIFKDVPLNPQESSRIKL